MFWSPDICNVLFILFSTTSLCMSHWSIKYWKLNQGIRIRIYFISTPRGQAPVRTMASPALALVTIFTIDPRKTELIWAHSLSVVNAWICCDVRCWRNVFNIVKALKATSSTTKLYYRTIKWDSLLAPCLLLATSCIVLPSTFTSTIFILYFHLLSLYILRPWCFKV